MNSGGLAVPVNNFARWSLW